MQSSELPKQWRAPEWHPDLGDPQPELELLQEIAMLVVAQVPATQLRLEIPEPGLMYLELRYLTEVIEIYVASQGKPASGSRFAIFSISTGHPETEHYATDVPGAVEFVVCRFSL